MHNPLCRYLLAYYTIDRLAARDWRYVTALIRMMSTVFHGINSIYSHDSHNQAPGDATQTPLSHVQSSPLIPSWLAHFSMQSFVQSLVTQLLAHESIWHCIPPHINSDAFECMHTVIDFLMLIASHHQHGQCTYA